MQLANAIKKLNKAGFEISNNGNAYQAKGEKRLIEFFNQDARITCIRVRHPHDKDDMMTDYHAGIYADNLTQAIRLAQ